MKSGIRTLETWYNKRLYRSRHEARWAVFLTTLREPFEYELEGFTLPPIRLEEMVLPSGIESEPSVMLLMEPLFYVPDFWLPRAQQWVEIKPLAEEGCPEPLAFEKARRLTHFSGKDVVIVCGTPNYWNFATSYAPYCGFHSSGDYPYLWCECPTCGTVGLQFDGRSDRLTCKTRGQCPRSAHGDKGCNTDTPRLRQAFDTATNYHFMWENPDALFQRRQR